MRIARTNARRSARGALGSDEVTVMSRRGACATFTIPVGGMAADCRTGTGRHDFQFRAAAWPRRRFVLCDRLLEQNTGSVTCDMSRDDGTLWTCGSRRKLQKVWRLGLSLFGLGRHSLCRGR